MDESEAFTVIPAQAGIHRPRRFLDYSLRSPSGPPCGRSTRFALLSGIRRDDGVGRVSPAGRNPTRFVAVVSGYAGANPTDTFNNEYINHFCEFRGFRGHPINQFRMNDKQ
ncbi:MAG TPA: hypothetical protein VK971_02460 [Thiohalobacter sp.]|nr:hypothetical protein [Thiohalobacter sp.]